MAPLIPEASYAKGAGAHATLAFWLQMASIDACTLGVLLMPDNCMGSTIDSSLLSQNIKACLTGSWPCRTFKDTWRIPWLDLVKGHIVCSSI